MKYTVPPETWVPDGFVGCVNPGPLVVPERDALALVPPLLAVLEEPQAATRTTMSQALSAATVLRGMFRRFRMISSTSLIVCVAPSALAK